MTDHPRLDACNCLALRQAARHVTQLYDHCLAAVGLRTTQFSILAKLRFRGPMTMSALARSMVLDRTTLTRNLAPLERDGLVAIAQDEGDRRQKALRLTEAGAARLRAALEGWSEAQARFDAAFGASQAARLRSLLKAVSATDFAAAAS